MIVRLRGWMRRHRPRVKAAFIMSYPLPMVGDPVELPESVWFKRVTDPEDRHLTQVEPPWRVRQAIGEFATGSWVLLAIDGDTTVGKLWQSDRSRGLSPWAGPHVRLAADESYVFGLWVDPAMRRSKVGLALAYEYGELTNRPGVNWLHAFVDADNVASLTLLTTSGVPMWCSQEVKLLKIGPAFNLKLPFSDRPRYGPMSWRGRHTGGNRVPGRPHDYVDYLAHNRGRAAAPRSVLQEGLPDRGPDWGDPASIGRQS